MEFHIIPWDEVPLEWFSEILLWYPLPAEPEEPLPWFLIDQAW